MADIVSKRDGPRAEDVAFRRVIEANRPTIERLADCLTDGAWSARRRAAAEAAKGPAPEGLIIHTARAGTGAEPPQPFVRVAVNGRVSIVDANGGRQMHHVGDLRRQAGTETFRLATRENGFFSPVAEEIAAALADLDGQPVAALGGEKALREAIASRLHL